MLGRAVSTHASTTGTKVQQPLFPSSAPTSNVQKPFNPPKIKRKLDRSLSTMNNLNALHEHVYFDENDFEDDSAIDLAISAPSPPKDSVRYPQIEPVSYPDLPPPSSQRPSQDHKAPTSSVPVPWSSSPTEHWRKPAPNPVTTIDLTQGDEEPPAKKRRGLPWGDVKDTKKQSETAVKDHQSAQKYPWNQSAAATKDSIRESRRKTQKNTLQVFDMTGITDGKEKKAATHLSDEQRAVARAVVEEGKSVFFTGSAGTGKSVLMRSIISQLRQKFRREPDRLAITASTGLAACLIEGTTLHSWAGIGLGKEPAPELVKKIKRNAKTRTKWTRTKVLIVDEISMVDGELFDKLEQVARSIRNNGRPFGGIQLVVTGDFFQLPPVPDKNTVAKFAFDAATWNTCIEHTILLTHVFRQKDPVFANMLNEMRLGRLSASSIAAFGKLQRPLNFHDDVEATELFPTRGEVDAANNARMKRLSGQPMEFKAVDSGVVDLNVRNKILANFMAPELLTLKKGAQVMLIKNLDNQLVNGTVGKIMSFMDEATWTTYKDDEALYHAAHKEPAVGEEEASKVAKERFDLKRFQHREPGQPTRWWPMVRFHLPDGSVRDMLCQPEEWKTETQQGEITAKRMQVPLILAWALSIHKAQGQTLSRVKVDLGKVFERGQAYVALSRATSQEGLQVSRFDPKKVMVHPKVISFYEKLRSVDSITTVKDEDPKKVATIAGGNVVDIADEEEFAYG